MITVCNSYKDATHIQYMYMQYVSLSVIKMAVWYCCYKPCNSLKKYSAKDIIHHSMSAWHSSYYGYGSRQCGSSNASGSALIENLPCLVQLWWPSCFHQTQTENIKSTSATTAIHRKLHIIFKKNTETD